MKTHLILQGGLLLAAACSLGAPCLAQSAPVHVVLNTGALNGSGTCYVEFTLSGGSAAPDGNSQVSISHFSITGGSLGAVLPPTSGSVAGSLGSMLVFADTQQFNDFAQAFTITKSTGTLSFDLLLANTSVDAVTPDEFSFQLLDSTQTALQTTGPTGTEFIHSDFTTTTPAATGFTSTSSTLTPPITATLSAAPEPNTMTSMALGVFGIGRLLCLRRHKRSAAQF